MIGRSMLLSRRVGRILKSKLPFPALLIALAVAFVAGAIPAVGVVRNRVNRRVRRDTSDTENES